MTIASAATSLADMPVLTALPVEHIADKTVEIEPLHHVATMVSDRLVSLGTSGFLTGPRLNAELLPGGGDTDGARHRWDLPHQRPGGLQDRRWGVDRLHRRGSCPISNGRIRPVAAGEQMSFGEIYMRVTTKFETADERYNWLNGL